MIDKEQARVPVLAVEHLMKDQPLGEAFTEHFMGVNFRGYGSPAAESKISDIGELPAHHKSVHYPTVEERFMRARMDFDELDSDGKSAAVDELLALQKKELTGEYTDVEQFAEWLRYPQNLASLVISRSLRVGKAIEAGGPGKSLLHPSRVAAHYFATKDTDGTDAVTKVTWFGGYDAGTPEPPSHLNARLRLFYRSIRMQMGIPLVRVESFSAAALQSGEPFQAVGFALNTQGKLHEIQSAGNASFRGPQRTPCAPYTAFLENTVLPKVTGRANRLVTLQDIPTGDEDAHAVLHTLGQLTPANYIIGAGLGFSTRQNLLDTLNRGSVGDVQKVAEITRAFDEMVTRHFKGDQTS